MSVKKDKARDYTSASLKLDGEFMGDDASKRPAEKVVGPGRIDLLDPLGIVFRQVAN